MLTNKEKLKKVDDMVTSIGFLIYGFKIHYLKEFTLTETMIYQNELENISNMEDEEDFIKMFERLMFYPEKVKKTKEDLEKKLENLTSIHQSFKEEIEFLTSQSEEINNLDKKGVIFDEMIMSCYSELTKLKKMKNWDKIKKLFRDINNII